MSQNYFEEKPFRDFGVVYPPRLVKCCYRAFGWMYPFFKRPAYGDEIQILNRSRSSAKRLLKHFAQSAAERLSARLVTETVVVKQLDPEILAIALQAISDCSSMGTEISATL